MESIIYQFVEDIKNLEKKEKNEYMKQYQKRTNYKSMKQWIDKIGEEEFKAKRSVANAKYREKQKLKKIENTKNCTECCGIGKVYLSDDIYDWCESCNHEKYNKNIFCDY